MFKRPRRRKNMAADGPDSIQNSNPSSSSSFLYSSVDVIHSKTIIIYIYSSMFVCRKTTASNCESYVICLGIFVLLLLKDCACYSYLALPYLSFYLTIDQSVTVSSLHSIIRMIFFLCFLFILN